MLVLIPNLKVYPRLGSQRDSIEIINKILREAKIGLSKNQIMNKCNLNYYQTDSYIGLLLNKKMLSTQINNDSKIKFFTTKKGKKFTKIFQELVKLV